MGAHLQHHKKTLWYFFVVFQWGFLLLEIQWYHNFERRTYMKSYIWIIHIYLYIMILQQWRNCRNIEIAISSFYPIRPRSQLFMLSSPPPPPHDFVISSFYPIRPLATFHDIIVPTTTPFCDFLPPLPLLFMISHFYCPYDLMISQSNPPFFYDIINSAQRTRWGSNPRPSDCKPSPL